MDRHPPPQDPNSLSLKLGGWLEAHATGWGVLAIPLIVTLALLAETAWRWLT